MVTNSVASSAKPTVHGRVAPSSRALWIVQGLLAALFLFAGGAKLVMPVAALTSQFPLPWALMRLVGVAEVSGALGLVLPGLLRIRPGLTPLAAGGLVLVMVGATVVTALDLSVPAAALPLIVGCLAAFVAYGRTRGRAAERALR